MTQIPPRAERRVARGSFQSWPRRPPASLCSGVRQGSGAQATLSGCTQPRVSQAEHADQASVAAHGPARCPGRTGETPLLEGGSGAVPSLLSQSCFLNPFPLLAHSQELECRIKEGHSQGHK